MTEITKSSYTRATLFPLTDDARTWSIYVAIAMLTTGLYFSHITAHPFDKDDADYLATAALMSENFFAFLQSDQSYGRPLVHIFIWIAYLCFGDDPFALHLLGLLVHTAASVLLALTCRRLGLNMELSLIAGLLFLVSVAHFRAVFWISAMAYPLALATGLLGLLCFLQMQRTGSSWWTVGAYAGLFGSVLSHVAGIALWAFCLFLVWYRGGDFRGAALRLLPLGAVLIAAIFFFVNAYPDTPQVRQAARLPQPSDFLFNLVWFCSRLVTTAHWLPLSVYHFATWEFFVGLSFVAVLAFRAYRGDRVVGEWTGWLLLTISPFLSMSTDYIKLLTTGPSRYLYLPCAASSLLLAYGVHQTGLWVVRRAGILPGRLLAATLLLLLFSSSFVSLREAEASSTYMEGRNMVASNQIVRGVERLQVALATGSRLAVDRREIYVRLGMQSPLVGEDALSILRQGAQEFPNDLEIHTYLAALEREQDDLRLRDLGRRRGEMARAQMGSEADLYDFNLAVLYNNLSKGYAKRGLREKAERAMEKSLELQSRLPELFK